MENIKKFATRKVIKEIERDTFFKQRCIQKFLFLIDNYGFNQIETEYFGKVSIIIFKKKETHNQSVTIEHEMGTLPIVIICLNMEREKEFSEEEYLKMYPIHYEIRQIVQGYISSIDSYIKELGAIWEKKINEISEEMDRSLDTLANRVKNFFKENS